MSFPLNMTSVPSFLFPLNCNINLFFHCAELHSLLSQLPVSINSSARLTNQPGWRYCFSCLSSVDQHIHQAWNWCATKWLRIIGYEKKTYDLIVRQRTSWWLLEILQESAENSQKPPQKNQLSTSITLSAITPARIPHQELWTNIFVAFLTSSPSLLQTLEDPETSVGELEEEKIR